ncbi:protealysin inhibitor emfourin [Actinacidiphila yeochonensis]|uniref:protealysin inhibitor emfourin n=1 Tax=Actinacidiphila yeochonensis TaxID=89050 RepID=UPI00056A36B2|nr:protealysin inhibitor emfourin [Actinacidiphila yeochonensis]
MRIEVVRSGGFAGLVRRSALETADQPDGSRLAALAQAALAPHPSAAGRPVPDGFTYRITAGGSTAVVAEPDLTDTQRLLVRMVLGEEA